MIKPPALRHGDLIGVVAPAGSVNLQELQNGIKALEHLGFRTCTGKSVLKNFRSMAGTDPERAEDLLQMFSDPEIKGVVCARGGYGSARLIPLLKPGLLGAHPKIFVGSSDITALLLYLSQQCQIVTFHGPMVCPDFGKTLSPLTRKFFLQVLTQGTLPEPHDFSEVKVLKPGQAEGGLVGGCLSLLCSSIGTAWELETRDSVLFLEDVREPFYRVDRMLIHLRDAGKFKGVRAVLFGVMQDCRPAPPAGYTLEEMILDIMRDLDIPILFNIPSGHGVDNVTLPIGVRVRITAAAPPTANAPAVWSMRMQEPPVEVSLAGGVADEFS